MVKYIVDRTAHINAIIDRDRGLTYETVLRKHKLEPNQFGMAVIRDLPVLIKQAKGAKKRKLEAIAADEDRKQDLLYMGLRFMRAQYERVETYRETREDILGETQKKYSEGTFKNDQNVEDLVYCALRHHNPSLRSRKRERVVNAMTSLPTNLRDYFWSIGLRGLMNQFPKGKKNSPIAIVEAFDRAYMRHNKDVSLFDLSQEYNLGKWDEKHTAKNGYWQEEENQEAKAWNTLTEHHPELLADDRLEAIQAVAGLPTGLSRYFLYDLELYNLMRNVFQPGDKSSPMKVLYLYDNRRRKLTGQVGLFDPNAPVYLSEAGFRCKNNEVPRIGRSKIFRPSGVVNGDPIDLRTIAANLEHSVEAGASVFLGDILRHAAITDEIPNLLIAARKSFPKTPWEGIVRKVGLDYEAHLPDGWTMCNLVASYEDNHPSKGNGGGNGGKPTQPITYNPLLLKPIEDGLPDEALELLADNYEPERCRLPIRPAIGSSLSGVARYEAEAKRFTRLDRQKELLVAKEIKYHELKARQAFNLGDLTSFAEHATHYQNALDYLIQSNLKLVVHEAKKRMYRGVEFDDLVQEGKDGLRVGIEKFEYWRGWKLGTYATWWVKQSMNKLIHSTSTTIRIKGWARELHTKAQRVLGIHYTRTGEWLTPEQVSAELIEEAKKKSNGKAQKKSTRANHYNDPTPIRVANVQEACRITTGSLYSTDKDDDDYAPIEFLPNPLSANPEQVFQSAFDMRAIEMVLEKLTLDPSKNNYISPECEYALRYRLGLGEGFYKRSLDDIGEDFGVTKETIRNREKKAKRKLARALRSRGITLDTIAGTGAMVQI